LVVVGKPRIAAAGGPINGAGGMESQSSETPHSDRKSPVLVFKRDVLAGLMFITFGTWGFIAAADLDIGTLAEMGPAYFPRIVCGILILLGVGIMFTGFLDRSTAFSEPWVLRPIVMVSIASLAFAALLERAGIVLAITATVFIGALAGERPKPLTLVALTAALILASIALFVWALGMRISVWPRFAGS
jgi:Tripartite tricarboxylate transporter TctB family